MSNKLSFRDVFVRGAVIFNPVLVQLAGLCPVVAASTSLKSAAMLSAVAFAELIAVCVIASAFLKKVPRWVRMPLYLIIGLVLICPVLWYIETKTLINLSLSMKIYIPLIAINSVVAVHCEQFAVKNSVKLAFYDAAAVGIGASAVFVAVGVLRELLGSATIGGMPVNIPVTFKGMLMPFGCLVILGFAAALLKSFVSKKYPEYIENGVLVAKKEEPSEPVITQESVEAEEQTDETSSEPINEDVQGGIKIGTQEEIDEFLKSLGIDTQETGDEQ
ncbi:MAG: hypothetical protein IJD49_00710 [Clostridia bacterium]|nr:hypothetical protein [Clostridia bacterium]